MQEETHAAVPAPPGAPALPPGAPPAALAGKHWRSEDLLGRGSEAFIAHDGQLYRLRRTSTGKLILTK
ncbi:MAG: hemin uptake protein HemP [Vitreoscilla sp.]|nr:hemin uptake protein HemP [Vitreoscilla sp.]